MVSNGSSQEVRVRFAPSPTGFLHVGGVRTALFNWLYARRHGGVFLIRIEDTDTERSESRYVDDILGSLKWLGIESDEPMLYQSKRFDLYREKAQWLVEQGFAYRCYCDEKELEAMRERALAANQKPRYDRRCRHKTTPSTGPFVIRAKLPETGYIEFEDLIRGTVKISNEELDDFVLVRSNGAPTYNFTNVVDDVGSKITHIIRGDDHINNTPKQVHLYKFFQFHQPEFAHLSMILGPDKKKLSKRHGDVSASVYRTQGYLPEALLNFLVRLGWSHGDQEVFSVEEMTRFFGFDHVQKAPAVFNAEKLLWLNGEYIRKADPKLLSSRMVEDFGEKFSAPALKRLQTPIGIHLVQLNQGKAKLLTDLVDHLVPLCEPTKPKVDWSLIKVGQDLQQRKILLETMAEALGYFAGQLKKSNAKDVEWGSQPTLLDSGVSHSDIERYLKELTEKKGMKVGDLAQVMRLGITGRAVSASLFELLAVLPWNIIEERLKSLL